MQETAAMKQITIASYTKDCKKLEEEKLQTSEGKFPVPKFSMLGPTTSLTFQSSRASLVLVSLFNRTEDLLLRNKIDTCRLLN